MLEIESKESKLAISSILSSKFGVITASLGGGVKLTSFSEKSIS